MIVDKLNFVCFLWNVNRLPVAAFTQGLNSSNFAQLSIESVCVCMGVTMHLALHDSIEIH